MVLKSLCAYRFYMAAVLTLPVALAHALPAPQSSEEEELTQVYGDADSVSIATGSAQSLRRAPAVASVITAADIAAMGATDLDQVLESVAGIHVSRSANNYAPLYVVRGIVSQQSPQVLVLQDGVPITVGYTGNKGDLWGGYPVDHIARIEVMRGPGSALYGSDAFSGVINIITKTAADTPGTEFGARDGSFRTHDVWVQHGGDVGPVDVAAYLRVGQSAGAKSVIGADAQSFDDSLFGTHASLAPGGLNVGYHAIDANFDAAYGNWRARLGYKLRDDLGTGAGIASALDPVGQQRSSRLTSSLAWADPQFGRDWGLGAIVSTQQYAQTIPVAFDLLPPGTVLPSGAFPNGLSARQISGSASCAPPATPTTAATRSTASASASATTTSICTALRRRATSTTRRPARRSRCRRWSIFRTATRLFSRSGARSTTCTCRTNGIWPRTGI